MLELVGDFFGRKKECVVDGISGGGPPGAHKAGDAPWTLVARCWLPLTCSQCQIFLNIPKKSYFNFRAFGELLFSGYFYMARIIQITDKKNTIFILFNINNRK